MHIHLSSPTSIILLCDANFKVSEQVYSLSGGIWDTGFRGEILYCPITDYGALPDDVLEKLVRDIIKRLDDGKRLGMFCIGGHGRTGYVAVCVLKRRGIKNPIAYLHTHYCRNAVESYEQRDAIIRFGDKL